MCVCVFIPSNLDCACVLHGAYITVSMGFAQPDPILNGKGLYDSCWILALRTWGTYLTSHLTSLHLNFLILEMRDNNTFATGSLLDLNTITLVKGLADYISTQIRRKLLLSLQLLLLRATGKYIKRRSLRPFFGRKFVVTGLQADETVGSSLLSRLSAWTLRFLIVK